MARNHGFTYRERIGPAGDGWTVLAFLCGHYDHSDETTWRERLAAGEVDVEGRVAKADTVLVNGQLLSWRRPPWDEPDVPLHYDLIYEDAALLAVAKPSGLPTMPAGGFLEHTLHAIVQRDRPGAAALHRLGRATSGLVLFALGDEARRRMHRAFRDHELTKRYRALAEGVAELDRYEIRTPIGQVDHPRLGRLHAASPDGRPSCSHASVRERQSGRTLFDVTIETGRPHQIRIHLASIGHPLVGDPLYGPGGLPREGSTALPGDPGYLLHAERLSFLHPDTGRLVELVAPVPAGLRARDEGGG